MNKRSVIIVGAGGHGAVVADALLAAGHNVLGFLEGNTSTLSQRRCGLPVLGDDDALSQYNPEKIVLANGIGSMRNESDSLRKRLQKKFEANGWQFCSVIHPKAIVSPHAVIEEGAQLLAGSIVQAHAMVGEGCIINTGSIVEHDATIGAWTHVAVGVIVCGKTQVGEYCHIGTGATLIQGLTIGANTLIGAGAVVVKDFAGQGMLLGVPAKPVG